MAPFVHIAIDAQSRIRPCCMFYPTIYKKKYDNVLSIFDGDENQVLRDKMLNGEKIDACSKCYIDEKIGKKSYRQRFNNRYLSQNNIKNPKIRELEIAFGNKCNLKCVTCNSYYSSSWKKDDLLLSNLIPRKIEMQKNIEQIDDEFLKYDWSELKEIKVLGGEPFLYKEYIDFFNKLDLKKITLFLVTNNTIFPNDLWLKALGKFKKVKINISIDGIDDIAEFVRYGTKFQRFDKNLSKWKKFSETIDQFELIPHVVFHSLNCFSINQILDWLNFKFDNDISSKLSYDFLDAPDYLNIKYLPDEIKNDMLSDLRHDFIQEPLNNYLLSEDVNYSHLSNLIKYISFLEYRDELPIEVLNLRKKLSYWLSKNKEI